MSALIDHQLVHSPNMVAREADLPPLTHKQTLFVRYYLETRNGTDSARKAGYKGDDQTLAVVSQENLRKPAVMAHLQYALKRRQISPDEVLAELGDIASAPWERFLQVKYGPNNQVLDVQLNLSHKLKALELAGKFHKLWDRQDPDLSGVNPAILASEIFNVLKSAVEAHRIQEAQPTAALLPAHVDTGIDL